MFRERIQDRYEELSPRFRALADFILENTLDVGFLTATELSRRVNVDPATVVRFSQEIGYSGFRELSREIKRYVNNQLALRYQKGLPEAEGLAKHVARYTDELSDRILSLKVDADNIAAIAQTLRDATRIIVVSKGDGFGIAALWVTYLGLIGLEAVAIRADATQSALTLDDVEEGDLVFAISLGLELDAEVGYILSTAQEHGLRTVALTTSPTLMPARQAETSFAAPSQTASGYPSFDTLIALLSILWQTLIAMDEPGSRKAITKATQALSSLVDQKDKVPPYEIAALLRLWGQG